LDYTILLFQDDIDMKVFYDRQNLPQESHICKDIIIVTNISQVNELACGMEHIQKRR